MEKIVICEEEFKSIFHLHYFLKDEFKIENGDKKKRYLYYTKAKIISYSKKTYS